ncbi:hypothetical protein [Micromonospora sp. 4G55]|uniref:hypothetical protein n=1 Tax=Micromonospora sp. 4G55 TaxID=2806102 RepID=UPI001A62E520|nr:hypothetical protein [Micromonospora sp. 4G55]MBM0258757.1 hypothetical protein [Micromonospora sp. 4G55]
MIDEFSARYAEPACQARRAGIAFGKDGNCFTMVADPAGLARVADALSQDAAVGPTRSVSSSARPKASKAAPPHRLAISARSRVEGI